MEEQKFIPADARIVPTVRKLKSNKFIDGSMEVRKNQDENKIQNNSSSGNTIDYSNKKILTPLSQESNNNNQIKIHKTITRTSNNTTNNNISNCSVKNDISKKELPKIANKISLDGSIQKPNTSSTEQKGNSNKTFDYETLKKYKKKPKTEYQRNILSKQNIVKYKEECLNLMKKDKEIQNLLSKLNFIKDNNYLFYINDVIFSKPQFLFVLEILILETTEEQRTLKVFRTNKNMLPLKVVKENYYKDEIMKDLKVRLDEKEFVDKYKNLSMSLENFISKMKNEII